MHVTEDRRVECISLNHPECSPQTKLKTWWVGVAWVEFVPLQYLLGHSTYLHVCWYIGLMHTGRTSFVSTTLTGALSLSIFSNYVSSCAYCYKLRNHQKYLNERDDEDRGPLQRGQEAKNCHQEVWCVRCVPCS